MMMRLTKQIELYPLILVDERRRDYQDGIDQQCYCPTRQQPGQRRGLILTCPIPLTEFEHDRRAPVSPKHGRVIISLKVHSSFFNL